MVIIKDYMAKDDSPLFLVHLISLNLINTNERIL